MFEVDQGDGECTIYIDDIDEIEIIGEKLIKSFDAREMTVTIRDLDSNDLTNVLSECYVQAIKIRSDTLARSISSYIKHVKKIAKESEEWW